MDLKGANANLSRAKTRELGSDADLKDLDFTRRADGTEFNEDMQKEAFKHGSAVTQKDMDIEAAKHKSTQ